MRPFTRSFGVGLAVAVAAAVVGIACGSFGEGPAASVVPTDASPAEAEAAVADADVPLPPALDAAEPTFAPVAIVKDEVELVSIAVGATDVFYTRAGALGEIMRVPKKGGAPPMALVTTAVATRIATFGDQVISTSKAPGLLRSWNASNGALTATSVAPMPTALVVDATGVVFLEDSTAMPGAFSVATNLAGAITPITTTGKPAAVAMNASDAFVGFNGATSGTQVLRRRSRTGSGTTFTSADFDADITAVDIDNSAAFVGSAAKLWALPLGFATGEVPTLVHDFGSSTVTSIRSGPAHTLIATQGVEGGSVYVIDAMASVGPQVPKLLSQIPDCALPAMTAEGDAFYFLCVSAAKVGSVWRVARK